MYSSGIKLVKFVHTSLKLSLSLESHPYFMIFIIIIIIIIITTTTIIIIAIIIIIIIIIIIVVSIWGLMSGLIFP